MPITTLPTRDPADLGAALANIRTPDTNEFSAVNLEKIKDWIIALGTEVGKTDGSTAGSLREAVDSSAVLFDLDTTGTNDVAGTTEAKGEGAPGGTAPAGALTVSGNVDADWFPARKCLSLTADASFTGIQIRRLLTGTLPAEGYVLDFEIAYATTGIFTSSVVIMLGYQQEAGTTFTGIGLFFFAGTGTIALMAVGDDGTGAPFTPVEIDSGAIGLPLNDWTRGPVRMVVEFRKVDGATPLSQWAVQVKYYPRSGEVFFNQFSSVATPEAGFSTPLDLDTWTPDRVGVGVWNTSTAEASELRFSRFRVYPLS